MRKSKVRRRVGKGAVCDPIILRDGEHVRLAFVPAMVDIPASPQAKVDGHFVYQRKLQTGRWSDPWTESLSTLKEGQGFKLTLHAEELLTLLKGLVPLYRFYATDTPLRSRKTAVQLDHNVAKFASAGEADLAKLLDSHTEDATTTLLKLVKWLATSQEGSDAARRLAAIAPEQIPAFTVLLGLTMLKDALAFWEQNQTNGSEEFWQQTLSERAFVLSQVFAYPVLVLNSKAYVGGKKITNKGGNIVDFFAAVESTDAVVLIEIKTPRTKLVGHEYRGGAFPISAELAGAVIQVLRYRQSLMQEFHAITSENSKSLTLGEPRCLVIAGHAADQLTTRPMRESFELQRDRLQGVTIITYDELFRRLARIIELFEGTTVDG